MNKPFHKPSVKKPPHVKKFSTQRYSSLCRDSKCPTIWMLVHCGAGTSLGPQLGTSRLSGRPAFGLTPSEPRGPSLRPLGSSCPSVNSIHSWVFTITALGAVVLSKELLAAPSVTSNAQHQVIWSIMKESTQGINHLVVPNVTTNAQDLVNCRNMKDYTLAINHSAAPIVTTNAQNQVI